MIGVKKIDNKKGNQALSLDAPLFLINSELVTKKFCIGEGMFVPI
jgi:hypothetical protein